MSDNALRAFVDRLVARVPLSPFEEDLLLGLPGETMLVDSNRDVVRPGQAVQHAYLIIDGVVARFGQTSQGQRQAVLLQLPGEMANLTSMILPAAVRPLQALTPISLMKIPHSALRAAADSHPKIARAFWLECAVEGSMLAEYALTIGRFDALSRMSHLIAELACRCRAGDLKDSFSFPFRLTQIHLGDVLGLTSVHVNRTIRALRERNIVTIGHRRADVHNWRALVALGEFDPAYLHLSPSVAEIGEESVSGHDTKRPVAAPNGGHPLISQPAPASRSLH